jgi:predicted glycosyltransferase
MGHLTRSFAIAAALTAEFRVVLLNGGPFPPGTAVPAGVEIVNLPPLGMEDGHGLVSRGALSVAEAKDRRRAAVLAALRAVQPAVLLIELFPFGRKKFAYELLPLLKAARGSAVPPLVACSLRDILVGSRSDQQHFDDRARWITDRWFDAVLVHADPRFARLEESFRPSRPLDTPLHYTGFVVPERAAAPAALRGRHVLVSAGGGAVGERLFVAALEAQARLWNERGPVMRLVTGPLFPQSQWEDLRRIAAGRPGLEIVRSVPDMEVELRGAGRSISQCGYNTALEIARSGVRALVVPYADGGEDEQMNRARRLERLGLVRVLDPTRLTGRGLAAEVLALADFEPRVAALDFAGAGNTARLLKDLWRRPRRTAALTGAARPA